MNSLRLSPQRLLATLVVLASLFITLPAFSYSFIGSSHCPKGIYWAQDRQPLQYYIHENGSNDLPFQSVEQIIDRAYKSWEAPCCSAFSASYAGQTSLTAQNLTDRLVLSFEEDSWPHQLGNPTQTIGVTIVQYFSDCTLRKAPILFNGAEFTFCEGGTDCADLESIAAHEIGHSLGLDHSGNADATMYPTYESGIGMRTLTPDDIDGVCALYPSYSCACTQDSDCAPDQACNAANQCEKSACRIDRDCPAWERCDLESGDCVVPSCASDDECDWGYQCDVNNQCITSCPVCRRCTSDSDCGADGTCGGGVCQTPCAPDDSCPGDSKCFQVTNEGIAASSGTCGETADCDTGVGEECFPDGDGGGICATPCTDDGNCQSDQTCQGLAQKYCVDIMKRCVNPNASSHGICHENYACESDEPDPCLNVSCPSGQRCWAGQCIDIPEPDAGHPEEGDAGTTDDARDPDTPPDTIEPDTDDDAPDTDDTPDTDRDDKTLDLPESDGPQHVFIKAEGCACSSTATLSEGLDELPGGLMLLGFFALGLVWRRRR